MDVTRCRNCGFCRGVRRAVDLALRLAGQGRHVLTDGELVHNSTVLRTLKMRHVWPWDGKERRWKPPDCILIGAHGVAPERRSYLRQLGRPVFDGTCPDVARVAGKICHWRHLGHPMLLFGDADHPEIRGLAAHGGESLRVVRREKDLDHLSFTATAGRPPVLLAQTTAAWEEFFAISLAVRQRFPKTIVDDTICTSTKIRRSELVDWLERCTFDLVVVVGGKNSANTVRLAMAARALGFPTRHVADADELATGASFPGTRVLLASGTSTPDEDVDAVERLLQNWH
ncbi:MAG: 4-hydroxy-3-methylbut-2-enyl diphosphate reductase [Puniceicoccales bacterium]|jgi:4-hydroxy-3-methylbut-2-enyl diphosphate reductase|nr:4-hydroxy-3-methylbut-2-enyl diphosphate reductase [Puniceicoccales bacterium]